MAEAESSTKNSGQQIWDDLIKKSTKKSIKSYEKGALILPPIPQESINGVCNIDTLLTIFKKWLYIEENYNITAPICVVIGNFVPGEVDIIGLIQQSGSIKTEIIRSIGEIENQYCYPISSITEHTFISGYPKNIDTISLLRKRIIVIKDLTTLLSKKEEIRSQIFADFRDITDGYLHKEFGNNVKKSYHDIHSSILFGCTNAIERYYSMYSNLGARMMFIRPINNKDEATKRAEENQGKLPEMRKELHEIMMSFIYSTLERLKTENLPEIPEDIKVEIRSLCSFLALIRTQVHHSMYNGEIDEIPFPEYPTRVNNTVSKLTRIHAFIHGRKTINEDDKRFAVRFIADNIPTMRMKILCQMVSGQYFTTSDLSMYTELPTGTLRYNLNELTALGIVDKLSKDCKGDEDGDKRADSYKLRNEYQLTIKRLGMEINPADVVLAEDEWR